MAEATSQKKTAAAAAKAENNGKPKSITYEGMSLNLPAKLPFKVLRHLRNQREAAGADIYGILETILGPLQTEELCELEIKGEPFDIDQGVELLGQVLEEFGVSLGEAKASPKS